MVLQRRMIFSFSFRPHTAATFSAAFFSNGNRVPDMDTQCTLLLERLKRAPITPLEALDEIGILRLPSRIWDLKQAGHCIRKEMVEVHTRNGGKAHVARYTLEEQCHD
jgi:hypothetical protein